MRTNRIDRDSPIPYYHQLKQLIIAEIAESGRLPGDRLPGDEALCSAYGVSRTVVRQALSELETAGLIIREKGRGTFVAAGVADAQLITRWADWTDELATGSPGSARRTTAGNQPDSTAVLRLDLVSADDRQAAELEIAAGDPVVHLERVRYTDGVPAVYAVTDLPHEAAPGLERQDLGNRPLAGVLGTEHGIRLSRARRMVQADAAGDRLAGLLQIRPNEPVLVLRGISYDQTGRPVLRVASFHRGDRCRLEVELRRPLT